MWQSLSNVDELFDKHDSENVMGIIKSNTPRGNVPIYFEIKPFKYYDKQWDSLLTKSLQFVNYR